MTFREKVHNLLEPGAQGATLGRFVDLLIILLIIANAAALVLETVPPIKAEYGLFFYWFEIVSIFIFTVEYLLRIYSCVEEPRYLNPVTGRLRFMATPMLVIDLLAILPFYLGLANFDARIIRMLRIVRIFRILKLTRYVKSLALITHVLKDKAIDIVVSLTMIGVLILISASIMYFAENEAQPEVFSSIPASMWWAVATLTTVGYGDIYPVTILGKIMGSMVAILGIAAIAVPTGMLSSAFSEAMRKSRHDDA